MPVSFYNESAYIRVVHDDGVVIYYVKATLVVQKHNPDTFSLKCGTIENFYRYSDVSIPVSSSIDDFLDMLAAWNTALSNTFQSLNVSTIYFLRGSNA